MGRQVSQYDKILKENIEAAIPGLMDKILGIRAVELEELPDDVQHTKERKPDVLKKVTDSNGNTFVLQIEFQVADEASMVYRMAEYYVMLARKYQLPVEQYVIYLGRAKPQMPARFSSKHLQFEFSLIALFDLNYELFLTSERPEEVVLSVLGNFKGQPSQQALQKIIRRIEETSNGDFALKRYFKQLRVLAQLRNLDKHLKDVVMDDLTKFFSQERDVVYMIAQEKTEERFVRNMLAEGTFSLERIANMAGVSVDFVKKIQRSLSGGK